MTRPAHRRPLPPRLAPLALALLLLAGQAAAKTRPARPTLAAAAGARPKVVFTGGPGVGKTTMINALVKHGFVPVSEAARHVIRREQNRERSRLPRYAHEAGYKGVLPWTDLVSFERRVLSAQGSWESQAGRKVQARPGAKGTVLDRSFVDPVAYLLEAGITPAAQPALYNEIFSRVRKAGYTKVFFLERLASYQNDAQRKETDLQAERLHRRLYKVYRQMGKRYGFKVVRVPDLGTVTQRLDYVLQRLR